MKNTHAIALGVALICSTAAALPMSVQGHVNNSAGVVGMSARSMHPADYDYELRIDDVNEICLSKFPNKEFTIECYAIGEVGAVKFSTAAEGQNASVVRVEGEAPFNIAGKVGGTIVPWTNYTAKVLLLQCMGFLKMSDETPLNTIQTVIQIIDECQEAEWDAAKESTDPSKTKIASKADAPSGKMLQS
jgi:hypothetical protein